jgi:hypothetical protein
VTAGEIHLFSYLSCLLSLYGGEPVSNWRYEFVATPLGAPFSRELGETIEFLQKKGLLHPRANDTYKIMASGIEECAAIGTLSSNSRRDRFHEAACSSLLALPIGIVREALQGQPGIAAAYQLHSTRDLLDETLLGALHEQFAMLSKAVGPATGDLMVPGIVWLSALAEQALSEMDER